MRTVIFALIFAMISSSPRVALAQEGGLKKFDLNQPISISWKQPGLKIEDRSINLSNFNQTTPIDFSKSFRLVAKGETDNALWMTEASGGEILLGHSGYFSQHPQLLEWLRNFVQGGTLYNGVMYFNNETDISNRLHEIQGMKMTLTQGLISKSWKLVEGIVIPHEQIDAFSVNAESVMSVTIDAMTTENRKAFDDSEELGSPLFIVTCSWGSDLSQRSWGSWGRYVFIMFPEP